VFCFFTICLLPHQGPARPRSANAAQPSGGGSSFFSPYVHVSIFTKPTLFGRRCFSLQQRPFFFPLVSPAEICPAVRNCPPLPRNGWPGVVLSFPVTPGFFSLLPSDFFATGSVRINIELKRSRALYWTSDPFFPLPRPTIAWLVFGHFSPPHHFFFFARSCSQNMQLAVLFFPLVPPPLSVSRPLFFFTWRGTATSTFPLSCTVHLVFSFL